MFREKALVKLKSPEQLDEALKTIRRKTLLARNALIFLATTALIWGLLGHFPEVSRGQGVLIIPESVVPIETNADGQIGRWLVTVGQHVDKGEVISILEQPQAEQELEQSKAKLIELKEINSQLDQLRARYSNLTRQGYAKKRELLTPRIEHLKDYIAKNKEISEKINAMSLELLSTQSKNLIAARSTTIALSEQLAKRVESYQRLRAEGLTAEDSLRDIKRRYDDSRIKIRNLETQIRQLDLKHAQASQLYLDTRNRIADRENALAQLNIQLREIENSEAQLDKEDSEASFRNKQEIKDLERTIERNEKRLMKEREIKSPYAGRIIELTAVEGGLVNVGQRVAQIEKHTDNGHLVALAYFNDKIGKQLTENMTVRVSPSTVSQKLYGSVVGHISSISEFPVSSESAISYVGNTALAEKLTAGDYHIQAFIELQPNSKNPSGYQWTSLGGPNTKLTSGTSTDVWVTYERRTPISYIIPVVKKWFGL